MAKTVQGGDRAKIPALTETNVWPVVNKI